jgi:hypothetical protein
MSDGQLVKTIKAHNETQLVKTIRAHLARAEKYQSKAEEHFITAGQYLMTLKGNSPDQATFLQIVKEQIGLGKSRTYELLQIADGTKTVEEVRERSNESSGKSHAKARETSCPLISGQTADAGNDYPADYQSPWDAHGQPAPDSEDEGDSPEVIWRRGLLHRAEEAAGHALYEDWSQFTADSEVIAAAERAADAWEKTAAYLRELRHARLRSDTAAAEPTTTAVIEPRKRGRPAGAKNKPKAIVAEATEAVADAAVPPSIDGEIYLSPSEADYGAALNAERQRRWENAPALADPYEIPPMFDRTQGAS